MLPLFILPEKLFSISKAGFNASLAASLDSRTPKLSPPPARLLRERAATAAIPEHKRPELPPLRNPGRLAPPHLLSAPPRPAPPAAGLLTAPPVLPEAPPLTPPRPVSVPPRLQPRPVLSPPRLRLPARVAVSHPPRAARPELAQRILGRGDITAWGRGRCSGYGATERTRRPRVPVLRSAVAPTSVRRFLRAGVSGPCGARGPRAAEETELGQRLPERGGRRGGLAEPPREPGPPCRTVFWNSPPPPTLGPSAALSPRRDMPELSDSNVHH
ncbi:WW domain-binding protein 11 [Symphalangus syndactylus]|uniref:WW domain-binding protein 11 n=1 Tax=Symphalangus syndactylus TaxID=9590 RepID=UPI0030051567